jgi:hypothetical protein
MLDVLLASEIDLLLFSGQWSYDVVDFFEKMKLLRQIIEVLMLWGKGMIVFASF